MSKSISIAVLVLALMPLLAFQPQEDEKSKKMSAQEVVSSMTWLAGTWKGPMWGGEFEAYYSTPEGGRVLSHSRLISEGRESFFEFEQFEVKGDDLHLQPFPGGKKVHGFTMTGYDKKARKITFENPKKDFPTRIVYHRKSDAQLVITLDDPHGKTKKVEVFELGRI